MHASDKSEFFSIRHWVVTVLDFLAIYVSGLIAFQIELASNPVWLPLPPGDNMLVIGTAACVALFLSNVVPILRGEALSKLLGFVTAGWLVGWLLAIVVIRIVGSNDSLPWNSLFGWAVVAAGTLAIARSFIFVTFGLLYRAGFQRKTLLLYGDAQMLRAVRARITQSVSSGFEIVKTIVHEDGKNISADIKSVDPDEIWLTLREADDAQVDRIVRSLPKSKANVRLVPDLPMLLFSDIYKNEALGIPMIDVPRNSDQSRRNKST